MLEGRWQGRKGDITGEEKRFTAQVCLSPRQATSCVGNASHASTGTTILSRKSDLEVYKWQWVCILFSFRKCFYKTQKAKVFGR